MMTLLMPSTFKTLILALLITFSFLAVSKAVNAADNILNLTWEQWHLWNVITEEVIIPIGKSLVPVIKDAGNLALEKSGETLEIMKDSFGNITNNPPAG